MTAFNTLEYVPKDKLDTVLAELARVARLRVLVAVQLPDFDNPNGLNGAGKLTPESFFPRWATAHCHVTLPRHTSTTPTTSINNTKK